MNVLNAMSVVSLAVVLCVSCATLSPERRYLGTWQGTDEGRTYTLEFEPNNSFVLTEDGNTHAGTWTLEDEGITVTVEGENVQGVLTSEGNLILSQHAVSFVFKRVK